MIASVIRRLNDRRDAAADVGEDAGFTLIELMVVLLILAILLAIAIPTFLGVTGGANDRAAQSNLNTAITTAKAAETQNGQSYSAVTAATLHSSEPSITFCPGVTGSACSAAIVAPQVFGQGNVSVYVDQTSGNGIVMSSYSKSGFCWWVADNIGTVGDTAGPYTSSGTAPSASPGQQYGKSTATAASDCNATTALSGVTWKSGSFPS